MNPRASASRAPDLLSVSCVIPVFNGARYLRPAIESVLAQTYRPLEVIVVDDGSTDDSALVAEGFGGLVRVLRQANAGQAAARDAGLRAARGELVALLDADDLWRPEKLARQIARFQALPQLQVSVAMAENFWEADAAHEELRYRAAGKMRGAHHFSSLLARRTLLVDALPLSLERSSGDQAEWFLRAADAGVAVDVIRDVLVLRRMHAGSLSHSTDTAQHYLELIKARLDRRRSGGATVG